MWLTCVVYVSIVSVAAASKVCRGNTCGSCITADKSCAWCTQANFSSDAYDRCDTVPKLNKSGCASEFIVSPKNIVNLTQNDNVADGNLGNDSIQLQPQLVNIKLRPNTKEVITLTFRTARNYPVDLYFLFDLSNTMEKHKNKLATLAEKLALAIKKISYNYQMGFGYFQDKVIMPFTSTVPAALQNPCILVGKTCAPPFGYRHRLPLTTDLNSFIKAIEGSNVTGNMDVPEGGLDAIMQAVACESEVGWREVGRRLLIYASDTTFHTAGDGRLAGIVIPNDCKCHVNGTGFNTAELYLDYPSVGQISQMVGSKNVLTIFAIPDGSHRSVDEAYKELSQRMRGSSVVKLNKDSSNIVKLVKTEYEKIISKVELKVNGSEGINIVLRSECTYYRGKTKTNTCDNLSPQGGEVTFDVEISTTSCPEKKSDRRKTVTIQPVGLAEKLTLQIDIMCECECEQPNMEERNSPKCSSGNGTFECGICSCNTDRYGALCECSRVDVTSGGNRQACIASANSTVECMNRGECQCGTCECKQPYSGTFCECNDEGCPRFNGAICGGPTRGQCVCGECACSDDYTGDDCSCSLTNETCIGENEKVCSGRGTCTCGKCLCEGGYVGNCQTCPTCPSVCSSMRPCAECVMAEDEIYRIAECADQCSDTVNSIVIADELQGDVTENICEGKDVNKCIVQFWLVHHGSGNTTMYIVGRKECPREVDLLPIIAGVIGGIVAVGLLLLIIWKLLTSMLDGIEYARFIQESKNEKWAKEINPIYKGPTTTFQNPMMEERMPLNDE
ncbi:integrin beta-PS-like [Gigantopelta aegis]|uniref:integrin beta-PS-like n=1 Tax=Gigantopelta aegis TaxID=1735272 RepID=UPI001B88BF85|nr:integrin beta-PS-like [Gigantopelta aegis]